MTARNAVGTCPKCRNGVTTSYDVARDESWQVRSECCRRWTVLTPVLGTVTDRECGPHCEDATGHNCRCQCGGSAHGITWRIR